MYLFRTSARPDSPRGDLLKSTHIEPLFGMCIHVPSIAVLTFFPVEVYILHLGCSRVLRAIMHLHVIRHAGQTALLIDRREKAEKTKELLFRPMLNQKSFTMFKSFPTTKDPNRFGG
jgi:hypothetical protein